MIILKINKILRKKKKRNKNPKFLNIHQLIKIKKITLNNVIILKI